MSDVKATIRSLEDRRYKAMCENDAATLGELFHDAMVYTHSSGTVDDKASYVAGIRGGKWKYKRIERPVEDIQVLGDTAVITGQARIDVEVGGVLKNLNSRFLCVWVKGAKGWQMAAWQSTPLPA